MNVSSLRMLSWQSLQCIHDSYTNMEEVIIFPNIIFKIQLNCDTESTQYNTLQIPSNHVFVILEPLEPIPTGLFSFESFIFNTHFISYIFSYSSNMRPLLKIYGFYILFSGHDTLISAFYTKDICETLIVAHKSSTVTRI